MFTTPLIIPRVGHLLLIAALCIAPEIARADVVTVNPNTTHQTITGWEVVTFANQDDAGFPTFSNALFNGAVNDVGINRIRLEVISGAENNRDYYAEMMAGTLPYAEWRCRRYSNVNDNNDPNVINPAGFHFTLLDNAIDKVVVPMRQRLAARGEALYINLNYVAFYGQINGAGCPSGLQYLHDDSPAEYAEFVLATFQHIQSKYGFVPDAFEMILEPDNTAFWNGSTIGAALLATQQKLAANGFNPKFIVPSCTYMSNALTFFDDMVAQYPAVVPYISELAYHRYGGVSTATLQSIANRVAQYNLAGGSMLEWWDISNSYETLHQDLEMGRNSAWQQGAFTAQYYSDAGLYVLDASNSLSMTKLTRYTSHYFKYIRRGAVRLGVTAANANDKVLAFRNTNGKHVVVGYNMSAGGAYSIRNLPAGTYGVWYSHAIDSLQIHQNLPDVTISAGQNVNFSLPFASVFTVYAKTPSAVTCDINGDSSTNIVDVQLMVNQSMGLAPCSSDINSDGICNILDIQRVVNAAVGGACATS
ncbi:MAG: hypothetical protein IT290_00580 [Deltaproteobacteria bacterium]|nr:hypothetical protein [Deltaproteobacteria bacterium]